MLAMALAGKLATRTATEENIQTVMVVLHGRLGGGMAGCDRHPSQTRNLIGWRGDTMPDMPMVPLDELAEKYRDLFIKGDSSSLTPAEEVDWNNALCKSLGMNPFTRPFTFIDLPARQGQQPRRVCYAGRNAAEQLRKIYQVSVRIISAEEINGKLHVHAEATLPDGRRDEDFGVVPYPKTGNPEWLANKYMTAVTKAKRRVTLSICGLGFLDETEVESIYAEAGRKMPEPNGMGDMIAKEQMAEAIARDPDPRPLSATRRLSETHANTRPISYADRRNPPEPPAAEDWEKRFGKQEPGEDG